MATADPSVGTLSTKCAGCAASQLRPEVTLKRCAKCLTTPYCSRKCQKADWKQHKKVCASNAASAASASTSTSFPSEGVHATSNSTRATNSEPSRHAQSFAIDKPFHQLEARTWMHGRSESDTFQLLIDAYRLRVEDTYTMQGDIDTDSLYDGKQDGRKGFRRFLDLAEKRAGLLPPWWSQEKAAACVAFGLTPDEHGRGLLACAVKKGDVSDYYDNARMPMQLRMFAEQVYTRGIGGADGTAMRQMMMTAESGGTGPGYMTHLSLASSMYGRG